MILWEAYRQGTPFHEILDSVALPVFADNEMLAVWYCGVGEVIDPEIVAFGEYQCGYSYLTHVKQAWRLNRQTEKIESVSTENISCQIELGDCHQ